LIPRYVVLAALGVDMSRDELRNATNAATEATCGAGIQSLKDNAIKREQDKEERAEVVANRRRLEREAREALNNDKGLGLGTSSKVCTYGLACKRTDCYFVHPKGWDPKNPVAVGGGRYRCYSPRHPTPYHPSFLESCMA